MSRCNNDSVCIKLGLTGSELHGHVSLMGKWHTGYEPSHIKTCFMSLRTQYLHHIFIYENLGLFCLYF